MLLSRRDMIEVLRDFNTYAYIILSLPATKLVKFKLHYL